MLFQYTWTFVVQEEKTQTRRLVKPGEVARRGRYNRIEAIVTNGRVKWQVGKTYAVQPGRGQAQIARIVLTRIRSECLSRISTADAIAEGFGNRRDFLNAWQHIHGPGSVNLRVWVLEFKLEAVSLDTALRQRQPAVMPT